MNQIVTFTGLETKTGNNDSGGWTLYLFKDAGGNKFQTFDDDLGHAGQKLIGQSAEVEYEVQERNLPAKGDRPATTVNNNVIKSLRAADAGAVESAQAGPVNAGSSFGSDRPIRSHETNRSDALGHAVVFTKGTVDAADLFALADAFTRYIETGSAVEETPADGVKF